MRNTISNREMLYRFLIAYYNAKCGYIYIMCEEHFSSSDKNERVKDRTYFKRFRYYASCSCEASIYKFNVRRIKIPRMIPHIRLFLKRREKSQVLDSYFWVVNVIHLVKVYANLIILVNTLKEISSVLLLIICCSNTFRKTHLFNIHSSIFRNKLKFK